MSPLGPSCRWAGWPHLEPGAQQRCGLGTQGAPVGVTCWFPQVAVLPVRLGPCIPVSGPLGVEAAGGRGLGGHSRRSFVLPSTVTYGAQTPGPP